jgi:mycoredoxin
MPNSNIIIYGTNWCWDCRRAKKFFDRNNIEYKWINIDNDKSGEDYVLEVNKGMRSVPTILFPDGSVLVEPSNTQLTKKVGNT